MITKTFYAMRQKSTGKFFFWEQLTDDGWRIYFADNTNFNADDFPKVLDRPEIPRYAEFHVNSYKYSPVVPLSDIELVPVTFSL